MNARALGIGATVCVLVGCAHRDPQPPRTVGVRIEAEDEPVLMQVVPDSASALRSDVVTCHGTCEVTLWTGSYRVLVEGDGVSSIDRSVHVTGPTRIHVSPGSSTLRDSGLLVALLSTAVLPVSLFIGSLCLLGDHERSCVGWLYGAGVAALGIPGGWLMYGYGRSSVQTSPLGPTVPTAQRSLAGASQGLSWSVAF